MDLVEEEDFVEEGEVAEGEEGFEVGGEEPVGVVAALEAEGEVSKLSIRGV